MTIIDDIQQDDPSFDPLTEALRKTHYSRKLFRAAEDRIFYDGYYGPINPQEWKEQDGRKPYYVSSALKIVATVLEAVDDYWQIEYCDEEDTDTVCTGHRVWDSKVDASEIRKALVYPWFKEIYGYGYPQL